MLLKNYFWVSILMIVILFLVPSCSGGGSGGGGQTAGNDGGGNNPIPSPTYSPYPTPSPTGSPTISPSPNPTTSPFPSPTPSPSGSPVPSPTPSPSGSPVPSPTPSPSGSPTVPPPPPPPPPPGNSITVTSPNGGELWNTGSIRTITWSSSGTIANMKIELSQNGVAGIYSTLFASIANTGSTSWTVAGIASTNNFIRISNAVNAATYDTSNIAFSISVPATATWRQTGFSSPSHLDIVNGELIVADTGSNSVIRVNATNGAIIGTISPGILGPFSGPVSIAHNGTYNYIADAGNNRIIRFNSNWTSPTLFASGLASIKDLSANNLFVAVIVGNQIRVFDTTGTEQGFSPLTISANALAMDSSNNLYIANTVIQKYSISGTLLATFGTVGSGNLQFNNPNGIKIDSGRIYVADTGNFRIQVLTLSGSFVAVFGCQGTGNGMFQQIFGIGLDTTGVYSSDKTNNDTQKFALP